MLWFSVQVRAGPPLHQDGIQSTFQCAKVSDQRLDVGTIELCAEPGHFAFDTLFNDFCDSGVAFFQIVEARSFIAARVIAMAMRAIVIEQTVAPHGFPLESTTRGGGNDVG